MAPDMSHRLATLAADKAEALLAEASELTRAGDGIGANSKLAEANRELARAKRLTGEVAPGSN